VTFQQFLASLGWLTAAVGLLVCVDVMWTSARPGAPLWGEILWPACGCWMAQALSLGVVCRAAGSQHLVAGALAAVLVQLGIPLALLAWASLSAAGRATDPGERVVVYFLATLLVETCLAVRLLQRAFRLSFWPAKR
jgi:hypothetical protein